MKTKSRFSEWFEQQHGKRPGMHGKTDADMIIAITDGQKAQCIRNSQIEWDARRESALYAWQASPQLEPRVKK